MTAENSTKKLRTEKSKREEETALVIKTILQLVIMAAVAVLFLSGSYLTYSDSTVTIPMTGIDVLTSLFYGGEVGFVNYGKILYVSIPWYAIGAGLLIVLAAVVFAVWTAISGFAGKKDAAAVGIAQMAFGGLLLLFYILCLVGKFMAATSAAGENLPFYKLYEIRPLFLLTACLFVFAGGVAYGCKLGQIPAVKRFFPFYVILIVPTLLILVFNVYPSILQTILAFKEYYLGSGVWGSEWAGLSNFKFIFSDARMQMVIWQTVYLSFLRLLAGIIPAVLFALVFYHITSKKYRSVVQTIVYIPHFFSWVVIYAIISAFLTPNGVVNNIIVGVFGGEPIDFLSKPELFYTNMILSSIWKEAGWAVVDLGGEYMSDKVVTSFWNDWPFEDVIVQLSSDFKTWESLYNSDTDGSMQDVTGETGADKAYKDAMWAGQVIAYGPKSFRYIRVYNVGRGGGGFNGKSVWQEISVFTTFAGTELEGAENLLGEGASLEDWNALGGSEWTLENGVLAVNGTGGWSRALALKDKKYKNFVIEGRFSMKEITAGLVGFELYKTTYTGSLNGSNGYVVFVENGGRVGAYDGQNGGSQEFGPTNVQAIGFSPTDFVMRVISVNDIISVSINGAPVFTVRNDRADMEAGYIAIHAGSIGITVKDLWIMELDETHGCGVTEYEDALDYQAETVQVAVPLLEKKEDVLKRLPAAVKFVTINGVTLEVPVTNWVSEDYDRKAAGWYNFTAETDVSGLGRMSNALGVRGAARVWVSAGIDIDAISIYIELAESLNESDYTPESWAEMAQKLTVALEIINDPFAVQNSVGVASFQLKDAIDALVNIRQDKTALAAAIESGKAAHTADKYTAVSFANYAEKLAAAEEVCASNIASQKSIDDALTALKEAEEKLVALGDKAALAREIEKAKATDKTAYTAESYAALERAVAEAEKVTALAAPTAEQVEIVSRNLQSALDGLIEAAQGGKEEQNEPSGCGSALNLPLVGALGAAAVILKKRKK